MTSALVRDAATLLRTSCKSFHLHIFSASKRSASTSCPTTLDLQSIDAKWRLRWAETTTKSGSPSKSGKPKLYVLSMTPYPSGNLHMGHLRVYTISDVLARFNRMRGYDVLHPMAWDAFGLPAENAAIERGVDPAVWTAHNIGKMKEGLQEMNTSFDWSRECTTSDPKYYKHTQRLFLMLYERGLAYQAESLVNYDPIDKTVLANEQVDGNGFSWRSGAKVELLNLKQWFLRITNFKESLLADLDSLAQDNHWPERVLSMQRNWLGRSQGANIRFGVVNEASAEESILVEVFTTRPDTLYGVQYLALSVTHPLVVSLCQTNLDLKCFVDRVPSLPIDSKEGFLLSGFHARNPLSVLEDSPATMRKGLPVYVAPYVLGNYGQGAVMGVPGHDARDYAFWNQNRGDENVLRVIVPADFRGNPKPLKSAPSKGIEPFVGKLSSACEGLAGFSCADASLKIMQDLGKAGKLAEKVETWRLRDWLISRQRYWGTPIPIIHCQKCGTVPVPEDELPVVLPKLNGDRFRGKGGNPIEALDEWVNKSCPKCNGKARRETDTMDTFMDSSWYFMRLADPHNAAAPFSAEAAEASLPVDIYIGGVEHAILHLLYARFVSKFFASTSFWPSGGGKKNAGEPFRRLVSQGMVHGKTYSNPETGRFLKLDEIDLSDPSKPRMVANGQTPIVSWEKMSKSKYNGVDPSGCIKKYGADATRAHVLFQAPVSEVLEWDETRIVGIQRWLGRVWRLVLDTRRVLEKSQLPVNSFSSPMVATPLNPPLPNPATLTEKETHQWGQLQRTILSITTNLSETFTLNTIISDLMELTNTLHHPNQYSNQPVNTALQYHTTNTLLRMLAPVAPAFAEECWERLHSSLNSGCDPPSIPSIFESPFPQIDSSVAALQTQVQTCIVQENGRWRLAVEIPKPSPELMERVNEADLKGWVVEQIEKTVEGKAWSKRSKDRGFDWKRVIVVKGGRVVNFVD